MFIELISASVFMLFLINDLLLSQLLTRPVKRTDSITTAVLYTKLIAGCKGSAVVMAATIPAPKEFK
jgi:hypothetical protein